MKTKLLTLITLLLCIVQVNAQQGKPSVKVFSNFNYDMNPEEGETEFKEFELKRAYLGYSYSMDENFSTKITFDVGSNDGGSAYTAFLKIAALNWKYSENLNLSFGMIGTKNFKFMEKAWGRRYIEKSALDKYKWANSADLGLSANYKLSDKMSIEGQILNGEGYKKTQESNGLFRGGAGITYKVNSNIALRLFHDVTPRAEYNDSTETQNITTGAITYKGNSFTIGAESSLMQNANNISDEEQELMSIYGSFKLSDNYTLFARYDDAKETSKAGTYMIYGVERMMTKGVKIALNVQSWTDDVDDAEAQNTLFLNLEYKF